jgi:archaellum component FlaG (FlaF/FlaG flagellin family)
MAALLLTSCPSANPPDGDGTPTTFTLTVQTVGDGCIESDPHAIDCPSICQVTLDESTTLTLIVTPHAGSTFDG